jgi:ribosomal protein S18 acetylase RimI-like enzyme
MLDGMSASALVPGTVEDAAAVRRLRDAAAEWLLSRDIEQWRPGEVSEAGLAARAEAGELFVSRADGSVAGAVVVVFDDSAVWGPDAGEAGYVHTLVIDRRYAGSGLGRRLLQQAEGLVTAQGRTRVRLDCVAINGRLRAYYRRAGYQEVGERSFGPDSGWSPVTLFQKHLVLT